MAYSVPKIFPDGMCMPKASRLKGSVEAGPAALCFRAKAPLFSFTSSTKVQCHKQRWDLLGPLLRKFIVMSRMEQSPVVLNVVQMTLV